MLQLMTNLRPLRDPAMVDEKDVQKAAKLGSIDWLVRAWQGERDLRLKLECLASDLMLRLESMEVDLETP